MSREDSQSVEAWVAQVGVFAYLCAGRHKRIPQGDLPSLRYPGSRKTGNRGYPLCTHVPGVGHVELQR